MPSTHRHRLALFLSLWMEVSRNLCKGQIEMSALYSIDMKRIQDFDESNDSNQSMLSRGLGERTHGNGKIVHVPESSMTSCQK